MNDSTNGVRRQRRTVVSIEENPTSETANAGETVGGAPACDAPEDCSAPNELLRFRAAQGEVHEVHVSCLAANFQEQLDSIEQLERPYVFEVGQLPHYEAADRWEVLNLIHLAGGECVQSLEAEETPADLYSSVLTQLVPADDVQRCKQGVDTALEAAVVAYPDGLPVACTGLAARLKKLKISGYSAPKLQKQAEKLARQPDDPLRGQFNVRLLSKTLPNAPVPAACVVPKGWELSPAGLSQEPLGDYELPVIAHAPLLITKRYRDIDSEEVHVELAWLDEGKWQRTVVPREQIADTRRLIALAAQGAPVHSLNAKEVVSFLADFEAANKQCLPEDLQIRRLGWTERGATPGFLLGETYLPPPAVQERQADAAPDVQQPPVITFRAADEGDQQLVAGYRPSGKLAAWVAAVQQVVTYPLVRFLLYASLAASLLRLLGQPNFVVDLSGSTSTGKTTALRLAASIWGNPDETAVDSIVAGCNTTRVALERSLAIRTDLPNFVDDTKRALRQEDLSKLIYDAASGRGRQRGTVTGTAKTLVYRTVLFLTGEAPATSYSGDGGAHARVLQLWGSPFGEVSEAAGRQVRELDRVIKANYGHVGEQFLQYLVEHAAEKPQWESRYREHLDSYESKIGNNNVGQRLATALAVINTAAELLHSAVELPWQLEDPVAPQVLEMILAQSQEADRATLAMQYVIEWATAHANQFVGGNLSAPDVPPGYSGYAGRFWSTTRAHDASEPWLGFIPHRLEEILREGEFEPTAIIKTWQDRNWLLRQGDRWKYRGRVGDRNLWLTTFRASVRNMFDQEAEQQADHTEKDPPAPQPPADPAERPLTPQVVIYTSTPPVLQELEVRI